MAVYSLPLLLSCLALTPANLPSSTTLLSQSPLTAPIDTTAHRLAFSKQRRVALVEGSIIRGERDTFVMRAQRGQIMSVSISALEDNAVFELHSPTGEIIKTEANSWHGTLPHTGDYRIVVGGMWGNTSYRMQIRIR